MLVRLFGKNFRSFKGEFELSMVAADLTRKEDRERGVIEVPIKGMKEPLHLLRCVAIYGPNASGKSTVLTAARALQWLVTESSPQAKPNAQIPSYEPFLLDEKTKNAPIELGCEVICNNSVIRYQIVYGANTIIEEKLISRDEENEVTLIDRKQTGVVTGKLIKVSKANQLYVQEMQPNVTVLSKLAQHGPHRGVGSAQPYFQAIQNATRVEDYATSTGARITGTDRIRFADDAEYREWIMMHLISAADVGISDVTTRKQDFTVPKEVRDFLINDINSPPVLPDKAVIVAFLHQGKTKSMIDYLYESSGTKKLLNISNELWMLAHESVTILADELSASLHPRLLDRMIRSINEYPVKIKSQLIFATHDTGLLESQDGQPPALRRDQVYFTKKDEHGASELYSLAEFKEDARPVHNIRKRYLSGLYGALPSLEKLKL